MVLDEANRAARTRGFDRDRVAAGPAGSDYCASRHLEVARQGGVLVTHVEVCLVAVVPPGPELDHPTGQGHRDLLVALADGRRFELRDPLFEIRAAVTTEIRGLGRRGAHGETAKRHTKRGCDGDAAGCFCQSPKHVHLHLP